MLLTPVALSTKLSKLFGQVMSTSTESSTFPTQKYTGKTQSHVWKNKVT